MNFKNFAYKHQKEINELKKQRKKEWDTLLSEQEQAFAASEDKSGLHSAFIMERADHNRKFDQQETDLFRKQEKELGELGNAKETDRGDEEPER